MNCIFENIQNNLPCRILPAVSKFNATDQEINFGQDALWNAIGTSAFYFAVKFRTPDKENPASNGIAGTSRVGVGDKVCIANSASQLKFEVRIDTSYNVSVDYNSNETYIAIINCDRSGDVTFYLNSILVGFFDISSKIAVDFVPANDMRIGSYGTVDNSGGYPGYWFNGNIYWVKFGIGLLTANDIANIETFESDWATYPVGNSVNEYDVYGNKNGVWNGNTANRFQYLVDGETFHNEKGISLWISGANKEYIPYYNGSARVGQAPGGYSKSFDSVYIVEQWNLSKGTINFDPNKTTDSKLDIFDKSNSIIHIATGSMDYYNAALPYEWTIEELSSYAKYNSYFNAAYQDRLFTKITNNHLIEILNCSEKQTGSDLSKAKTYCGIT